MNKKTKTVAKVTVSYGLIYGHLKGFGYCEFTYENVAGLGWSLPSASGGTMTGEYVGKGIASPKSFTGYGQTDFSGVGFFQLGKWNSYNNETEKMETWMGEMSGIGFSIPMNQLTSKLKWWVKLATEASGEISEGRIETNTKIVFPVLSDNTQKIFEKHYDR
jgi:hypothetical protein